MAENRTDVTSEPKPTNWVDEEFAGEHGTTASPSSVEEEKAPEVRPQSAHELVEKVKGEAPADPGVIGTAKKAFEEIDRQFAGEYEKRDDRDAPEGFREQEEGAKSNGAQAADQRGKANPTVAGAAVEAETERFDGLINEPANPSRQPALDPDKQGNGGS